MAIKRRKLTNDELGRLDIKQFQNAPKRPLTVVLDQVRSLNNIGSVFRSCDAFRVEELILCGISTPPPHREIHKSALGAEYAVSWRYFKQTTDAVKELKSKGFYLIGIEQTEHSIPLNSLNTLNIPIALIFGHEIHGVSQEVIDLCDTTVEIPQFGTKHSFNVAVSAGIVLWEIVQNRNNDF